MENLNESQARHALLNKDYNNIPQLSQTERDLLCEYQRLVRNLNQVSSVFNSSAPCSPLLISNLLAF